ncbi:MAG: HD domain-containing protein [Sedimentisphaerales bacterium]|nr:HD domain-containing protein [Sedimentisphaerales bacterium]
MSENQRKNVADLTSGDPVEQVFMISQPVLRTTTRGDFYIAAFLNDRTGRVNGRMWQASEVIYNSLPHEGFVWLKGRTETYQSALQIVIDAIKPVDPKEIKLDEFMPCTDRDVDEMMDKVKTIISRIKNPHLHRLMEAFLADEELMRLFKTAPAAILLHHAYIGGLLEHTLNLLEVAELILPQYPQLSSDLVLAGLFLHDMGKTTEIDYDISFTYSDQGHLLGHLVKGTMLIEEKINALNQQSGEPFPRVLADCLEHIIVSHHGTREFGCPVVPSIPEAFMVHYLDNLDSKIALVQNEINKDVNKSNWTNYIKALETPLFKIRPE